MSPLGHLAMGFAAQPAGAGSKVPLGVLLAASWLLDILYFVFAFAGLESLENMTNPGVVSTPYSHGLLMALVWSLLAALLAGRVYRSQRAGVLIGLLVFSHWVLDFISWDNLCLFFAGSPQVGLGLFKALGGTFTLVEVGLFAAGLVIYLVARRRTAGLAQA